MKKISIIIPAFNAEKYVKKCEECLKKQTFKNFEVIFINDGSSDKTLQKLQECNLKNKIIIDQVNKGVSAARNAGIDAASGDYITFLDIDDEYREDYLEKMVLKLTNDGSDAAICNYYEVSVKGTTEVNFNFDKDILLNDDICNYLIFGMVGKEKKSDVIIWGTVWRTMIRTKFLKKIKIKFDEKMTHSEDYIFLLELFSCSKKISIVKENLYYYYRNQTSSMNKYIVNYYEKNLYIHKKMKEIFVKYDLFDKVNVRYKKNKFHMYTVLISNCARNSNKRDGKNELKYILNEYENEFKSIYIYLDLVEKCNYFLLKYKMKNTLFLIYNIKEKIRLRKMFK